MAIHANGVEPFAMMQDHRRPDVLISSEAMVARDAKCNYLTPFCLQHADGIDMLSTMASPFAER